MGNRNSFNINSVILYISTNKLMHLIIKNTLSGSSVEIHDAYNAEEALEAIKRIKPDLILSDIDLPDINGIDLCKLLNARPSTSKIPIVIYSGTENEEIIMKAYKSGAKGYIIKKYQNEELANKILHFLK